MKTETKSMPNEDAILVLGDPVLGQLSRDVSTKREAAEQTPNEEKKGRE